MIQFGKEKIYFDLQYADCKRLSIHVYPNLHVVVIAPFQRSLHDILIRVQKRADWIIKQKGYFEQFQPLPPDRKYISGETHFYLGRQYRLKIKKDNNECVKLIGKYLHVCTRSPWEHIKAKTLIEEWYREHAAALMMRHVHHCYSAIRRNGLPFPRVRFRRMKTRWGSFGKAGTITLNVDLIKAPLYCIDYVIMHELCHLKYPNHGRAFYKFLGYMMPDWRQRKERLDKVII
jgi:predicted metal-dependent hydrolase